MAFGEPRDTEKIEQYEEKQDNPVYKGITNIPSNAVYIIAAGLFIYFIFSKGGFSSTNQILLVAGGVMLFLFLKSGYDSGFTTKKMAESLARNYIKEKQIENAVPRGRVIVNGKGRLIEDEPKRHLIGVDITEDNGIRNEYVVVVDAKRGWNVLDFYVIEDGFLGWEHISRPGR